MAFKRSGVRFPSPPNIYIMSDQWPPSQQPSDSVDPDIMDLLQEKPSGQPHFSQLMSGKSPSPGGGGHFNSSDFSDISRTAFPELKDLTSLPQPHFADKNFYKIILKDEGEISAKIHKLLGTLINTQDPETRSNARLRLIPAYWDLISKLSGRLPRLEPLAKRLCMRYGILLPSLISADQRKILSVIHMENKTGEPVHYMDEWITLVSRDLVNPLATDEVKIVRKNDNSKLRQKQERLRGQIQAQIGLIQSKQGDRNRMEVELSGLVAGISNHMPHSRFSEVQDHYTEIQKQDLSSINEIVRKLQLQDKEMYNYMRELAKYYAELDTVKMKLGEGGDEGSDSDKARAETNTLRQLAKLTAGRQGNKLPILLKQYMPHRVEDVATRENVIRIMAEVERLDPGLFKRSFKGNTNRIVPHMILLPSYGDEGYCWEPFEKFNKASSRGRVGIPLYPKNLKLAVLSGLADLRWQVAKEWAQHYWMEEGLTGFYYQWFLSQKMKGDVRIQFIQDYILWITKESEGTQKLHKEVRGIFWRNIPFPEDVRDSLRNRGFIYSELYKKDINRALSDGY
jgi:hypothetical protein